MAAAVRHVIASFAVHAPAGQHLVIKQHPLDNGLRDWRSLTLQLAAQHDVAERIHFLERGDIAMLVASAQGVVTINSTTGTLVLAAGVPVITMGRAIYDVPDITFQGLLDAFWQSPGLCDRATFSALRRVLIERCLIPGGFFSEEGLEKLCSAAVARIEKYYPPMPRQGRPPPVPESAA